MFIQSGTGRLSTLKFNSLARNLDTEVITLQYLDGKDAKKFLEPLLSPRGKLTIVEKHGQKGWQFGETSSSKNNSSSSSSGDNTNTESDSNFSKKERSKEADSFSRTLIIIDIPSQLDIIKKVLTKIDKKPRQVLIQTRIMEVNRNFLRDIGVDFGTGRNGAESTTITTLTKGHSAVGGNSLSSMVSSSGFTPKSTDISGAQPFNSGLSLLYQKLNGNEFEILVHALEEDSTTNTLSAPRIVTLENQEASILIGTKYPILKSDVTGTSTSTVTASLDYYENIGIQLNVVPQINEKNQINMVIHPAISSFNTTLKSRGSANQIIAEYPIIETREAETQVLMEDAETVVIGGLLKDSNIKTTQGVPFLNKIPLLGALFKRDTNDTEKIDLLIFITTDILEEGKTAQKLLKGKTDIVIENDNNTMPKIPKNNTYV